MSKIKILDSIMGSGKTSAVITMMNEREIDRPVIFITPFLAECERFARECDRDFVQPVSTKKHGWKKLNHIKALVGRGRNIVSTHALFRMYSDDILEIVRKKRYILIMDEACEVLEEAGIAAGDVKILTENGLIEERREYGRTMYKYIGPPDYLEKGSVVYDIMLKASNGNLYKYGGESGMAFYSIVPANFITSFEDVYILTYMFQYSDLHYLFIINNISWTNVYVKRVPYGNGYDVTDEPQPMPDYVRKIPDLVHVYQDNEERSNNKGRKNKVLNQKISFLGGVKKRYVDFKPTVSFFNNKKRNAETIKLLKNNQYTFFLRMIKEHGGDKSLCLWSTYKSAYDKITMNGLKSGFLQFNSRATNDYADRCYLSYVVDIRVDPNKFNFYEEFGIRYPEDGYALSTMIQWIWRSRIRKGEEIWVYVPSRRMRDLLTEYLDSLRQC